MGKDDKALYSGSAADFLKQREKSWDKSQLARFDLLMKNLGECHRLVDIGCGWGQFLKIAANRVDELWGVDESAERTSDLKYNCPKAKLVTCRADNLLLPSEYFDVAVTSQMLHEVKLFGSKGEVEKALGEIHRILKKGGRYLLLDHRDSGEGTVVCRLPMEIYAVMQEFEKKFKYYPFTYKNISEFTIEISKHALQDFLTKIWSLNTPMESMEMVETHNAFSQNEVHRLLIDAGFDLSKWIDFMDINEDIKTFGCELVSGDPWFRKFLCVAVKK